MIALSTRSASGYLYLVVFFALLSGIFHPFIAGSDLTMVVVGMVVLVAGLAGGILLYKAATLEKKPAKSKNKISARDNTYRNHVLLLVGGFILVAVSLAYVYQLTGRI